MGRQTRGERSPPRAVSARVWHLGNARHADLYRRPLGASGRRGVVGVAHAAKRSSLGMKERCAASVSVARRQRCTPRRARTTTRDGGKQRRSPLGGVVEGCHPRGKRALPRGSAASRRERGAGVGTRRAVANRAEMGSDDIGDGYRHREVWVTSERDTRGAE